MQTDKIEEAQILQDNDTDDLISKLNAATEEKTATNETVNSWDFSVDKETPEALEPKLEAKEATEDTAPGSPASGPKLSKDLKEASARITVSALDSTQRVIFTPLINRKYAKKFTESEIKKLDDSDIIDEDKSRLDQQDIPLRNKFDRLMKKRDKKIKDIPFTSEETNDLEKICYQYMDMKNATLPPELMLTIGIVNVLSKRAIDLFTE